MIGVIDFLDEKTHDKVIQRLLSTRCEFDHRDLVRERNLILVGNN